VKLSEVLFSASNTRSYLQPLDSGFITLYEMFVTEEMSSLHSKRDNGESADL
jgi:hypothetical protein